MYVCRGVKILTSMPSCWPALWQKTERNTLRNLRVPVGDNEEERLKILRETRVLDSDLNEQCFDRYTTLATRLFNVPITLISLVDIDRQWFKSRVCLTAQETHRDHAFCAYAILEESPDVFVVLNAEADDRFKNNPLVTGPPYIRFYAGAALIVDNIKVGTLCIIDTIAHNDFSLTDKMNLMDLSASVSHILSERRAAHLNQEKQHSQMMLGFSHNLRTPLMCLAMGIQNLRDDVNKAMEKHPDLAECINHNHFKPVNRAIGQLTFLVESSLQTTELMSLSNNNINEDVDGETNNILPQLLDKAMTLASSLNRECKIKVQPRNLDNDITSIDTNCHLPHPEAFFFVLVNSLSLLVPDAESVDITTLVVKGVGNNCNIEVQLHAKGESFHENEMELRMNIGAVKEEENNTSNNNEQLQQQSQVVIDNNNSDQEPWKMFSVKQALNDIGGKKSFQVTSHGYTLSFSVPCEIREQTSLESMTTVSVEQLVKMTSGNLDINLRSDDELIRVLVVEDSIPIQKVMKNFLKGKGCEVSIASNGKEGVDLMKQQHSDFDVLFMDFLMPIMDGLTATKMWSEHLKTLRLLVENKDNNNDNDNNVTEEYERKSKTLLIGMSATASPPELSQAFDYGMTFFCPKPVCLTVLTAIIDAIKSTSDKSRIRRKIETLCHDSKFIKCPSTHQASAPPQQQCSSDNNCNSSTVLTSMKRNPSLSIINFSRSLSRSFSNDKKIYPDNNNNGVSNGVSNELKMELNHL
eukprot:gene7295-14881_t